jgi:hypothetical protein
MLPKQHKRAYMYESGLKLMAHNNVTVIYICWGEGRLFFFAQQSEGFYIAGIGISNESKYITKKMS